MTSDKPDSTGRILTEIDGSCFWITFDNPDRMNALNTNMWRALPEIISQAESNDAVRIVLLRGTGNKAFSAGADISEFGSARTGDAARDYDAMNHTAFESLMDCAKPTIAMINGYCMGGGMEIALCCDMRVAAEGSTFAIPSARLGIGYDPRWIRPLLSALSAAHAKEVLFTGRRFTCEEAFAMGAINRICEPEALEDETMALAETIAANAPLSVLAAKKCIDELMRSPENPDMEKLDALVRACFDSADYAEGRAAFAEKRKPRFHGK